MRKLSYEEYIRFKEADYCPDPEYRQEEMIKGGEGSGNFDHEGRQGEVGGSAPSGKSVSVRRFGGGKGKLALGAIGAAGAAYGTKKLYDYLSSEPEVKGEAEFITGVNLSGPSFSHDIQHRAAEIGGGLSGTVAGWEIGKKSATSVADAISRRLSVSPSKAALIANVAMHVPGVRQAIGYI